MSDPRAETRMRQSVARGMEFWNDSCAPRELAEAAENGATGATSNPVIVHAALKGDPATWTPVVDRLIAEHREADEEEIAWALVAELGRRAAAILEPVHRATEGRKGFLSMQVSARLHPSTARMVEHGRTLAALAPNVAIKVPATPAGIRAGVALVEQGTNVNATVSFTVPQAVAVGEAFEGAIDRALSRGVDPARLHPYVTLMVGRLDDHLQRVMAKEAISIEPGFLNWAGIAVFKRARAIFRERRFRSTLLVAAYRHHLHWSELVGPGIVQSIPYAWWTQFEKSDVEVRDTLDQPVDTRIVEALSRRFADFRRAYEPGGLRPEEFAGFGATIHTLHQFIGGYQDLLGLVRERMLR